MPEASVADGIGSVSSSSGSSEGISITVAGVVVTDSMILEEADRLVGSVSAGGIAATELESELASIVDATVNTDVTADAASVIELAVNAPFSIASTAFSAARLAVFEGPPGMKRVHQNAIRSPRSTIRCFRMKSTTRMKNMRPARMRRRSSQSDFSSAVMRCFDEVRKPSSTS